MLSLLTLYPAVARYDRHAAGSGGSVVRVCPSDIAPLSTGMTATLQGLVGASFKCDTSLTLCPLSPGMTATLQGLVGASFECVGVAIGSGFGGLLYSSVGGARMFQVSLSTELSQTCLDISYYPPDT